MAHLPLFAATTGTASSIRSPGRPPPVALLPLVLALLLLPGALGGCAITPDANGHVILPSSDGTGKVKDGMLDFEEYCKLIRADEETSGLTDGELRQRFNTLDVNQNGKVSVEGFLAQTDMQVHEISSLPSSFKVEP